MYEEYSTVCSKHINSPIVLFICLTGNYNNCPTDISMSLIYAI